MNVEVPYGRTLLLLNVPDTHQIEVVTPEEVDEPSDPDSLIKKALMNPVGGDRLEDIVRPGDTVSIIVSDTTRPGGTDILLPPLLENLHAASVERQDIRIVFGLGIHRNQTEEEKINIVGREIFQKYRCIDHERDQCRYFGITSRGTPVEIFQTVAESDIVICTGIIQHHYFAGYTGGYKALLPGVSSQRSIEANHSLMIQEGTAPGNPDCPVRSDMEEGGRIAGVDFILNVILNSKKKIVGAVAGHPVEAHRAGARIVDSLYKQEVEPADIIVVSPGGWPKDINVFQSHKALEHVKAAVKPGGAIILAALCAEGLGNDMYEEWLNTTSGPEEAIERFNRGFVQGGHKAALVGKLALKYQLYLVSDLPSETIVRAYFKPASSVQEAFDRASSGYGADARVLVVPNGGSMLLVGKGKYHA